MHNIMHMIVLNTQLKTIRVLYINLSWFQANVCGSKIGEDKRKKGDPKDTQ